MCEHIVVCVVVGLGVPDEDTKLTIKSPLNALAVVGETAGLAFKVPVFLFRVDVLFEALHW